jgi:hypothetical protein
MAENPLKPEHISTVAQIANAERVAQRIEIATDVLSLQLLAEEQESISCSSPRCRSNLSEIIQPAVA